MSTSNGGRKFEDKPAVREATPLLVGLIGPSGTGKTFSALRIATGIQRVSGGEIFVIDTESRRSLHYADKFRFRHLPFGEPFGSLDYLAAIEHCVAKGAKVIVVDSMSHEHEGPGGLLEQHEAEVQRLSGGDWAKAERVKMLAWAKPKAARRRLINSLLQINANFVFCFRAKEKLKIKRGEEPTPLGFMPIAGEEFVYELTAKCLLLPGANGTPTWTSENIGERLMMKLPEQFKAIFAKPRQIDEQIGVELATWARGEAAASVPTTPASTHPADTIEALLADYLACCDEASFNDLERRRKAMWSKCTTPEKQQLKAASDEARQELKQSEAAAV